MTITYDYLPGLKLTNINLQAPLDHRNPSGELIDIFARVVTGKDGEHKPYLVFLQGGPGNEAPRPSLVPSANPGWLPRALEDFQVVMLDQRGTGLSTPVSADPDAGPLAGKTPEEQAEYLTHMRADEIVNDAELIREALGAERWTLLGQSFGGFTSVHYLSTHPDSLAGAILTGGLTSVDHPIDDVYSTTWRIMIEKSERYYRYFPQDRDKMRRLADLAGEGKLLLPGGDKVSPARLRTAGLRLGGQGGATATHWLLELDPTSAAFRHDLNAALPFETRNPIYAILHESSYADGVSTRWSAERTMPDEVRDDPTIFAGEHIHRSLFEENSLLRPLAKAANIVADHEWNKLYWPEKLAKAEVPVAAIAYANDAYVPLNFSQETAAMLPDCRLWVTNEFEHNGLRMSSHVLDHLIKLLHGDVVQ